MVADVTGPAKESRGGDSKRVLRENRNSVEARTALTRGSGSNGTENSAFWARISHVETHVQQINIGAKTSC